MLAVARRKCLYRLGGPHCCGVDGARYRSPEGSLAPEKMGRTVHTVVFKYMISQSGDGARFSVYFVLRTFFAYYFFHHLQLETRYAHNHHSHSPVSIYFIFIRTRSGFALASSGFAFERTTVFRCDIASEGIIVFRSEMLLLLQGGGVIVSS